jgi:hypothetical protein
MTIIRRTIVSTVFAVLTAPALAASPSGAPVANNSVGVSTPMGQNARPSQIEIQPSAQVQGQQGPYQGPPGTGQGQPLTGSQPVGSYQQPMGQQPSGYMGHGGGLTGTPVSRSGGPNFLQAENLASGWANRAAQSLDVAQGGGQASANRLSAFNLAAGNRNSATQTITATQR